MAPLGQEYVQAIPSFAPHFYLSHPKIQYRAQGMCRSAFSLDSILQRTRAQHAALSQLNKSWFTFKGSRSGTAHLQIWAGMFNYPRGHIPEQFNTFH